MRRADGNLWARFAAVCVAAAGCGASDPEIVRIDAPDFDPTRASRGFVAAVFHEGGRERSVWLRVLRAGRLAEPWLTVGVHGERGGEPEAHLIVAAPFALLNHHLAASHASLAEGRLRTSQLAVVGDRLGLLFDGPPAGAARTESLATLEAGELARVLALCEVLGAWRTVARGRVEVDADGRALLPFFVPSTPGDWRGLMAESLETFLPAELGARVAREPALRAALEAHLYAFTGELPGLGEAARALAERVPPVDLDDDIAKLDALFTTSFAAIRGYLDSVWIETLFERIAPDRVRLSLVVNAVAPVRIVELRSRVARSLLIAESVPVGVICGGIDSTRDNRRPASAGRCLRRFLRCRR